MSEFKKGDEVRLKGSGQPVCHMLVADPHPTTSGLICCMWLDTTLRMQGHYIDPALLESVVPLGRLRSA